MKKVPLILTLFLFVSLTIQAQELVLDYQALDIIDLRTIQEQLTDTGYNFQPFGKVLVIEKFGDETSKKYKDVLLDHKKEVILVGGSTLFPRPAGNPSNWVVAYFSFLNGNQLLPNGVEIPDGSHIAATNYKAKNTTCSTPQPAQLSTVMQMDGTGC
ncbi:MAG: hypothetical protein P8P30_05550 [Rickettsiales bacterium]|nr:hypothetical protein [Rickettsiales bacterium]